MWTKSTMNPLAFQCCCKLGPGYYLFQWQIQGGSRGAKEPPFCQDVYRRKFTNSFKRRVAS